MASGRDAQRAARLLVALLQPQRNAEVERQPQRHGRQGLAQRQHLRPRLDARRFANRHGPIRDGVQSGVRLPRGPAAFHVKNVEQFRVQVNKEKAQSGVKLTLLALLMKACAAALKKFPEFNASLNGDELVLKRYCHIGFAADTPQGLVVPVIKDVDQKGVLAIAREMSALAEKAREGKLSVAEMSGGCFSISSLGGIGGTYFTPIINAPEVAILGVGKSRERLALEGGQVVTRNILPLSLSWDHRVIDGATAGRFNAYLGSVLADYRRLVL